MTTRLSTKGQLIIPRKFGNATVGVLGSNWRSRNAETLSSCAGRWTSRRRRSKSSSAARAIRGRRTVWRRWRRASLAGRAGADDRARYQYPRPSPHARRSGSGGSRGRALEAGELLDPQDRPSRDRVGAPLHLSPRSCPSVRGPAATRRLPWSRDRRLGGGGAGPFLVPPGARLCGRPAPRIVRRCRALCHLRSSAFPGFTNLRGCPRGRVGPPRLRTSLPLHREPSHRNRAPAIHDGAQCGSDGAPGIRNGARCGSDGAPGIHNGARCGSDGAPGIRNGARCGSDGAPGIHNGARCGSNGAPGIHNGARCGSDGAPGIHNGARCGSDGAPGIHDDEPALPQPARASLRGAHPPGEAALADRLWTRSPYDRCDATHSRSASSIRVCQPSPVDLKYSTTSGLYRRERRIFLAFLPGPR